MLPFRVIGVSFLILALPLLVDSFIFFQQAYETSTHDAENVLKETSRMRGDTFLEIEPIQEVFLEEVIVLLDLPQAIKKASISELNENLKKLSVVSWEGSFFDASIVEQIGPGKFTVVASSSPDAIHKPFPYYEELEKVIQSGGKGNFIHLVYSEKEGAHVPIVSVVAPIRSDQGVTLAYLIISSFPGNVSSPLLQKTEEKNVSIEFAFVLTEGEVIYRATNTRLEGNYFKTLSRAQKDKIVALKELGDVAIAGGPLPTVTKSNPAFFEFSFEGELYIAYILPIDVSRSFMAYTNKDALFGKSIAHFLLIYASYGIIFILGGIATYFFSSWISRPFVQLMTLMEKVRGGDIKVRFQEQPLGFEINILGGIFNRTLDSLFSNIQKAEKERILKETYQKELEMGKVAQSTLIPSKMPEFPGLEFAAHYIFPQEVGGDFFDISIKNERQIMLTVADAASKGISSCLYALSIRSLLRTYATLYEDVGVILSAANNMFLKDTGDTGMFATVLMGNYDAHERILSYYSCGHVPGIIRRHNGEIVLLVHTGMALGLRESTPFIPNIIELFPGDTLIFFTDGLINATNPKHQYFSQKRLETILQHRNWKTAEEVVKGILFELEQFTEGVLQEDEIEILVMRIKEES